MGMSLLTMHVREWSDGLYASADTGPLYIKCVCYLFLNVVELPARAGKQLHYIHPLVYASNQL